ncbi:hypothetical protein O2F50_08620 [Lacticaseibacillus paracasei]|uniref:Uncharacterized protein n=1 Tax=Lacticaseibacillus paracasei TaxID=1597 RepID=A0A422MC55_LACPA|nr:hypothetical protein [Lacticaseibacillus paracasei]MCZ2765759.1 hypothetical protein [Lacticaseibacillus paracasei]MCZ2768722.1 hypothetical protein [Lacticaseibacillus paracasei]MCZ2774318.1 hypothetical protein [Lacticaseibacillus paracasei]MCZ2777202.1 hypothetical protein [Lacticaseibacillus paracasei]MCZ2783225.1 hypothetical protein [Lacticaseibacillus paracasei]
MRIGINRFMSCLSLTLAASASFLPAKYMNFGAYKTFICLTLVAILLELWDVADVIREVRDETRD